MERRRNVPAGHYYWSSDEPMTRPDDPIARVAAVAELKNTPRPLISEKSMISAESRDSTIDSI
jgi:hypothetical protein